jgi:PhnB protein
MRITPHLTFSGRCREAFEHYRIVLGGDLRLVTYGDSPLPGPPDWIVHATLDLGQQSLAGADVPADPYQAPRGFFVLLTPDSAEDGRRIFDALADGGEVRMPLAPTFWSPAFGVLVDRFGIPWEISC